MQSKCSSVCGHFLWTEVKHVPLSSLWMGEKGSIQLHWQKKRLQRAPWGMNAPKSKGPQSFKTARVSGCDLKGSGQTSELKKKMFFPMNQIMLEIPSRLCLKLKCL